MKKFIEENISLGVKWRFNTTTGAQYKIHDLNNGGSNAGK